MDLNNNYPDRNNNTNNNVSGNNGMQNNNGYSNGGYGYGYTPPVKAPGSSLANAAMILGIVCIISALMMTVYFPFILGSMAILFSLLSRGLSKKLASQAKAGIICGIIGLAINLSLIITSVSYVLSNPDRLIEVAQVYDNVMEQMYGVPSEDILGDSMEDMVNDILETFK